MNAQRLSVLQVVGGGGVGGVERISVVLAQELIREGHHVTHLVLGEPGATSDLAREAGVDVRVLGLPLGPPSSPGDLAGVPSALATFARTLRPRRYDLIQSHLYRSTAFARLLGRVLRVPVVAAVHGVDPDAVKRRRMAGLVVRVDATVCVSHGLKRALVQEYGFPARRLVVVPNGLPERGRLSGCAPGGATPIRMSEEPGAVVIGCLGRLHARKGQRRLLEAFIALAADLPATHLGLVGGGPDLEQLRQVAAASEFAERIHLVGEQADPAPWLRGFDVLAVPGDLEGFGLVVLEAQRAGVPVVSCAAGGPADLIQDGVSGRQVEPAQLAPALAQAVRDPARRAGWARAAVANAERYTAAEMARGYLAVYREVLARRGPPAAGAIPAQPT